MLTPLSLPMCAWAECDKRGIHIAYDRDKGRPLYYCDKHVIEAAENRSPEYVVNCPNCGCRFGVN